jgi:hypothetical protein
VDGPIHPAPAPERGVGGIDNGVGVLLGDVPFHDFQDGLAYFDLHNLASLDQYKGLGEGI